MTERTPQTAGSAGRSEGTAGPEIGRPEQPWAAHGHTYEHGRRCGPWRVIPWTCAGGYRLERFRWVDDIDGADMEHERWERDRTVYATKEAATAALEAFEGAG